MRAGTLIFLMEYIIGSVFLTGGVILLAMGKMLGLIFIFDSIFLFAGGISKICDRLSGNKNWRDEEV